MATTNGHSNGHSNGHTNGAGAEELTVPIWINGKEETLSSTFDVINPSTGKPIWKSSSASKEDAKRAVDAAQAAFPAWRKTKSTVRRDIFLKAADILESRAEAYGEYMQLETGSEAGFSTHFNIPTSVSMLRDIAGRIITITNYMPECAEEGRSAMVLKEPYGVVLGIAPWWMNKDLSPIQFGPISLTFSQERTLHPRLPRCCLRPRRR